MFTDRAGFLFIALVGGFGMVFLMTLYAPWMVSK